ncbi:hypothetical protein STSO111631_05865 [Stackebrandtia soli]
MDETRRPEGAEGIRRPVRDYPYVCRAWTLTKVSPRVGLRDDARLESRP